MNYDEFTIKQKELLKSIPEEFRDPFSDYADRTDLMGTLEGVYYRLEEMINSFKPSIDEFEARIRRETIDS